MAITFGGIFCSGGVRLNMQNTSDSRTTVCNGRVLFVDEGKLMQEEIDAKGAVDGRKENEVEGSRRQLCEQ